MERTLNQPHARHERKLKNPIIGLLDFVISYLERRKQRADLQCMSEHMLKDIGLSRADVMREASKPFWRP